MPALAWCVVAWWPARYMRRQPDHRRLYGLARAWSRLGRLGMVEAGQAGHGRGWAGWAWSRLGRLGMVEAGQAGQAYRNAGGIASRKPA